VRIAAAETGIGPADIAAHGPMGARLEIARDGRWMRREPGPRVDLLRRRVLRDVLVALVEQRLRAPGVPISADELIARSWPGQRIRQGSARNRLYVALSSLRALGLRGALERTRAGGYRLSTAVSIEPG
jgi:hypothetical protein